MILQRTHETHLRVRYYVTDHYTIVAVLLISWMTWWLFGVNWSKAWPMLAAGAWAPLVLLIVASALGWSQLFPRDAVWFGFLRLPNFWWQLVAVACFVALALFCGWLQGYLRWTPAEISVEPAPASPGHGHDSGHH